MSRDHDYAHSRDSL